jgi:RNA polymerase sigma-70 factor, ECF subfamily
MRIFKKYRNSASYELSTKLDSKEFERLFIQLYAGLCRYSIRFVRKSEVAEEIVQDQFVYLWEKRNELIIHSSFKNYLYVAVKHRSLDYLRSSYAKIKYVEEGVLNNLESPFDLVSVIENQEIDAIITKAISSLPERCAIVFSMKRYGEYSNKQIAECLNISEKTVENQVTIAIKKLQFILSKSVIIAGIVLFS